LLNQGQPIYSDSVPVGAVAKQAPPAGSVLDQGLAVSVSPSRGSATVDLATLGLVGTSGDEARQLLTSLGLNVDVEEVGDPNVTAGTVVTFAPPGSITAGETVTLLVSVGDAVRIPIEITGRPVNQVLDEFQGLDLVLLEPRGVSKNTVSDLLDIELEEIVDGDVVGVQDEAQLVDFGTWVPRGSRIALLFYDRALDSP
nr:PASTA domain-containing protein [Chloroflexota bacterium]